MTRLHPPGSPLRKIWFQLVLLAALLGAQFGTEFLPSGTKVDSELRHTLGVLSIAIIAWILARLLDLLRDSSFFRHGAAPPLS